MGGFHIEIPFCSGRWVEVSAGFAKWYLEHRWGQRSKAWMLLTDHMPPRRLRQLAKAMRFRKDEDQED